MPRGQADQLNVSVGAVRNNIGWYKGMSITDDQGNKSVVYLKEKGVPFRTEQLSSAMKPKDKYPLIELKDRSIYDLIQPQLRRGPLKLRGARKNICYTYGDVRSCWYL